MKDWYKENIEPEIRDVVKELRNKGVNTTVSCGHEMYVEGDSCDLNETERTISLVMLNRNLEFELVFVRTIMEGANYRRFHLKVSPSVDEMQCMQNNLKNTVKKIRQRK